jgi:hypothetical protein
MVATPQDFIEIPGYAEELARERDLRRDAFSPLGGECIAGLPVKDLTPRHLLWLDALHNGLVCAFDFESNRELAGQIGQFLWIVSPGYAPPRGFWHRLLLRFRRRCLILSIRHLPWRRVVAEIKRYLDAAFYDAPQAPADAPAAKANTLPWSGMLYDEMVSLGYAWSYETFLDTPFKRLWTLHAIARHRMHPDSPLAHPSDQFAVRYIERLNARESAA